MKISLLADQNQMLLYRDKQGLLFYTLVLGVGCLAFGAVFVSTPMGAGLASGKFEQWVPLALGLLFLLAGVGAILASLQIRQKMVDQPGHVLLQGSAAGLVLSPALNAHPTTCSWAHVERIVVADKFDTRDGNEREYSGSRVLIYLRADSPAVQMGMIERANRQLNKGPAGELLVIVPYAAGQRAQIVAGLQQFAPSGVPVASCRRVLFDYGSGTAQLED